MVKFVSLLWSISLSVFSLFFSFPGARFVSVNLIFKSWIIIFISLYGLGAVSTYFRHSVHIAIEGVKESWYPLLFISCKRFPVSEYFKLYFRSLFKVIWIIKFLQIVEFSLIFEYLFYFLGCLHYCLIMWGSYSLSLLNKLDSRKPDIIMRVQ